MKVSNNLVVPVISLPKGRRAITAAVGQWHIPLIAELNQSPLLWVITARVSTLSESGKEIAGGDVCRQGVKELFSRFYQGNHIMERETFNQLGRKGYYPGSPPFSHLVTSKHHGLRRKKPAFEQHSGLGTLMGTLFMWSHLWLRCLPPSSTPMRQQQRSWATSPPSLYQQVII